MKVEMGRQIRLHHAMKLLCLTLVFVAGSCQTQQASYFAHPQTAAHVDLAGLAPAEARNDLAALVFPPDGWTVEPIRKNSRHIHQVWKSPSGNTAYGVILLKLPWPVGPDITLWGFLKHMEESEGQAVVLQKQWDPNLPGFRFTADGKLYEIRAKLVVHQDRAWAVYAGTVRDQPIDQRELEIAQKARDYTEVDIAAAGTPSLAAGGAEKH